MRRSRRASSQSSGTSSTITSTTQSAGDATTFWAGLGAIQRTAFLEAGGFDAEQYRAPSIEDVELGLRLAAAGARIRLDPSVRGTT